MSFGEEEMSHTVACGRSKKKKCVCQCGGKLHGELVVRESRAEVLIDSSHDTQVLTKGDSGA